jgi:hypothetical protein
MSSELKNCPFCGSSAIEETFYTSSEPGNFDAKEQQAKCSNRACILGDLFGVPVDVWNNRYLEDFLNEQINKQSALIEKLGEALDIASHMKHPRRFELGKILAETKDAYTLWKKENGK